MLGGFHANRLYGAMDSVWLHGSMMAVWKDKTVGGPIMDKKHTNHTHIVGEEKKGGKKKGDRGRDGPHLMLQYPLQYTQYILFNTPPIRKNLISTTND